MNRETLAAIAGGVMVSALTAIGMSWMRSVGITAMNLELVLGSLFTGRLDTKSYFSGLLLFLILGGLTALIYVACFRWTGRSGVRAGALLGTLHWVITSGLLGLSPFLHPLIPERLAAPGVAGIHLGRITPILLLSVHIIYGMLVGYLYEYFALRNLARTRVHKPEIQEPKSSGEAARRCVPETDG